MSNYHWALFWWSILVFGFGLGCGGLCGLFVGLKEGENQASLKRDRESCDD